MGIANRLQHPGWAEILLPIALAIGSTFSPRPLRFVLLISGVAAATWIFHTTKYAGRKLYKTIPAAAVFLVIATIVFWVGRTTEAKTPPTNPSIQQPQSATSHPDNLGPPTWLYVLSTVFPFPLMFVLLFP